MKRSHPERPWATGVLVLAGAISLSFNVVHSVAHTHLPPPLALLYGAGPVVLAAMQSHVVAIQAARGELVDGWRKFFTFSLVIGALALSFLGIYDLLQHEVPNPIRAAHVNLPAILTPIVVDLMALAALHELLRPSKVQVVEPSEVRRQPTICRGSIPLPVPQVPQVQPMDLGPVLDVVQSMVQDLTREAVQPAPDPVHLEPALEVQAEVQTESKTQVQETSTPDVQAEVQHVVDLIGERGYDAVTLGVVQDELNLKKSTAYNRLTAARRQVNQEKAS